MKRSVVLALFLSVAISPMAWTQVLDVEDNLREKNNDTIMGWRRGGVSSLNLSQTSLTNWAAGGQNSFSVNGLLSLFAHYKSEEEAWDNTLDIGYGLLKQGRNSDYMKTDDKFDFLSKYGRQAFGNFYYAALFNFRTQMTPGFDYAADTTKISNLLAPAYLLGALGLDYKPNNYFSAFIAPVTGKITIVNDQELADQGAFGVDPGENTLTEFGGYVRLIFSRDDFTPELLRNVSFTTKLDLFSNYLNNPQNIDVNWETLIAMKVNRFLSVNFTTHLIYDDDIDIEVDGVAAPRVQFKEILAVGFSYNF